MIDPGTIRMIEETLENLVAKHNLSAYTTKPDPVALEAEAEKLHFDVHWSESAETVLKKTILEKNMEPNCITNLLQSLSLKISDQIEKIFLKHLYQEAKVRNITMPGSLVVPSGKKEFLVDQISALVHEDFESIAPPMVECVISDNLEDQICANSQFRIANFPKETKRMITDSMYVNTSEHLETMEALAFVYEYVSFSRPQIKVTAREEDNMLSVDVYLQKPSKPLVEPVLYMFW